MGLGLNRNYDTVVKSTLHCFTDYIIFKQK